LEEIIEDFDNVRSAWNWALEQGNRQAIDQAQECLHIFFDVQGRYLEGREFFSKAKKALAPASGEKADKMYGRLLTRRAFMGTIIATPRASISADLKQGMEIAQEYNDRPEIALNLLARGTLLENPTEDLERFKTALRIYEELNDDFYRTRVYMAMANCYSTQMQPKQFKSYVYQAVDIARSTGNIINLALGVGNLAEVELVYGRYEQAQKNIDESIVLANQMHAWLLISYCNCVSGFLRLLAGNFAEAEAGGRTGLAQAEEIEHQYLRAFSLAVLSLWAGLTGNTDSGLKWALESSSIPENNMMGLVLVPWGLATNYARLGQWDKAAASLLDAFKHAEDQVLPAPLVWLMAEAALIAAEKEEWETAVRFLSISKNHPFKATGWMTQWPRLANLETELKEQMSDAAYKEAWAVGMGFEEVTLPPEVMNEVYELLNTGS
jgi:tetratricopeptide (TPR) repeat protein